MWVWVWVRVDVLGADSELADDGVRKREDAVAHIILAQVFPELAAGRHACEGYHAVRPLKGGAFASTILTSINWTDLVFECNQPCVES